MHCLVVLKNLFRTFFFALRAFCKGAAFLSAGVLGAAFLAAWTFFLGLGTAGLAAGFCAGFAAVFAAALVATFGAAAGFFDDEGFAAGFVTFEGAAVAGFFSSFFSVDFLAAGFAPENQNK